MSLNRLTKILVPARIRKLINKLISKQKKTYKLAMMISPCIPECICIDVGASYYPHTKWEVFKYSRNTNWIVIEPNQKNIEYIKTWEYPSNVKNVATGLSKEGGKQTLYVTNIDSGSSLLKPEIPQNMMHRINENGLTYFFPIQIVEINTIKLSQVIEDECFGKPIFIKLDTQGTELSILQGAEKYLHSNIILGIEMESTLLVNPIMMGSKKFWEACQYLEQYGYELMDMLPIRGTSLLNLKFPKGKRYLNECDAVFTLRRDIVNSLPIEHRVAMVMFYIAYEFYEEALSMIDGDENVKRYIEHHGVDFKKIKQLIMSVA